MGNVGFVGVGKMGSRMVKRLMAAGHEVTIWNRRDEFYDAHVGPLKNDGAKVAKSPRDAAQGRNICFTSVTDGKAFGEVCMGESGITAARPAPALLVDTSTIGPFESEEVAKLAESAGIGFLRAPVSGSLGQLEAGELTILGSGDREVFDAAESYLSCLGSKRIYVGPEESARYLKLILNMQIYAQLAMLAEGAVMGEKAGIDWSLMLDAIGVSVAGSTFLKYKISKIVQRDYGHPHFTLRMVPKDLALALDAGERIGASMSVTALIISLWEKAIAEGWGDLDASAVTMLYEKMAGLEPKGI